MTLSLLQEGIGTWNSFRNKSLGGKVNYKLCSCLTEAAYRVALWNPSLPNDRRYVPRLLGHDAYRENLCTILAFTYSNMGVRGAEIAHP